MVKSGNNSNHSFDDVTQSLITERKNIERTAKAILSSLKQEFPNATEEELLEIAMLRFSQANE